MTKIRGGKAILDELAAVRDTVRAVGHDNVEHATVVKLTQDNGKTLLQAVRTLDRLIAVLDPMLDRIETRVSSREVEELERRLEEIDARTAALEQRVALLDLDRRGVVPFVDRKQERG